MWLDQSTRSRRECVGGIYGGVLSREVGYPGRRSASRSNRDSLHVSGARKMCSNDASIVCLLDYFMEINMIGRRVRLWPKLIWGGPFAVGLKLLIEFN